MLFLFFSSKRLPKLPLKPKVNGIFIESVGSILSFGLFVQLFGVAQRFEGLVHL